MAIIEAINLAFSYAGAQGGERALAPISLRVEEGEFCLVTGPTGCGKTTLLRACKPELAPQGAFEGSLDVCGVRLIDDGAVTGAMTTESSARSIGFVMQDPDAQIVCDTVWHELAFGLENVGADPDVMRRRVAEVAHFLGIASWMDWRCAELSGGQKQLVNLAAALVQRPALLLLDEPLAQLDPAARRQFAGVLSGVQQELGLAVVVATHMPGHWNMVSQTVSLAELGCFDSGTGYSPTAARRQDPHPGDGVFAYSCSAAGLNSDCGQLPACASGEHPIPRATFACASGEHPIPEQRRSPAQAADVPSPSQSCVVERETDCSGGAGVYPGDGVFAYSCSAAGLNSDCGQLPACASGEHPAPRATFACASGEHPIPRATFACAGVGGREVVGCAGLFFRFGVDDPWVLRGLDFEVQRGSVHAVVGGNGCGKTTLLRLIGGELRGRRGKVRNEARGAQAYLPQDPRAVFACDSVDDELREWQGCVGYPDEAIDAAKERFGLVGVDGRHPYDLSGGQRQMLALAKMLLVKPQLLLLDEPTKGLDARACAQVVRVLREEANRGVAVVIATHDLDVVAAVADEATLLFDGQAACTQHVPEFFEDNLIWRPQGRLQKELP